MKTIRKKIKSKCWSCSGRGCKACKNTGVWIEDVFYYIVKDKEGNLFAFDGDTYK